MTYLSLLTSFPTFRCSHNPHRPKVRTHSDRGSGDGRGRPGSSSIRSALPSTDVPPAGEPGNSRLRPSGRSRRSKAARLSCCAGILLLQPSLGRGFHSRWLAAVSVPHLASTLRGPDIAFTYFTERQGICGETGREFEAAFPRSASPATIPIRLPRDPPGWRWRSQEHAETGPIPPALCIPQMCRRRRPRHPGLRLATADGHPRQ